MTVVPARAVAQRRRWDEDGVVAALDFGLATATEDFDGAFRLQHDEYVGAGYMSRHPTGRRVTAFNALPSTRVFVARDGARVVGTVTLVQDSPDGLPMDQVYREELSVFRARGRRLGEASTLTIDHAYRRSGLGILMRLYRLLSAYALTIARLDDLCMVVRPHHVRFYETFFPFRQIGPTRPYPRLNRAPFVGFRADLRLVRSVQRVVGAGLMPGTPYEFLFAPRDYRPVLARLRRDLHDDGAAGAGALAPELASGTPSGLG